MEMQEPQNRLWLRLLAPVVFLWILAVVFSWFYPERGGVLLSNLAAPVLYAFCGVWLFGRARRFRTAEVLLIALTAYYVLTRVLNGDHYLAQDANTIFQMVATALIAFPFAANYAPDMRQKLLKRLAFAIVFVFGAIAWIAVVAAVLRQPFQLPKSPMVLGINSTYSYPSRLNILDIHPNISGALFSIVLGLTLYLGAAVQKKWRLIPLIVIGLGLFAAIALTLSRTAMVVASLEIGGFGYLLAMRKLRISSFWPRFVVSLLICAALSVLAFIGLYQSITPMNAIANTYQDQQLATVEAEPDAAPVKKSTSIVSRYHIKENVGTFSDRLTVIYPAAIPVIRQRPATLLVGNATDEVITAAERLTGRKLYHWHNSLLQTLMTAGLPAFLFALAFSVLLLIKCARIIFSGKAPLPVQVLTLPVLGAFLNGMLENLIFMNIGIPNLLFMLLSGFLFAYHPKQANTQFPASAASSVREAA